MSDFSFATDCNLDDLGSTATKYDHNVAALRLLKELEAEGRTEATLHEQTILSRYTGWGDSTLLKRAFPHGVSAHLPPSEELKELLTGEELKALRASSLNAHYTSLPVIRAIYAGLGHTGIHRLAEVRGAKLRVLEPAAGIGHFIGAMPREFRDASEWAAVELDPLSARITRMLYPGGRVFAEGFESANLPSNWFDLCVSNVPFGNYKVCDPEVKEPYLRASIHDYFFAKGLRVTKPGGVIAFITSRFTLDKQDNRLRSYLALHAELLACVRLPNDAFTANAGPQVVTDVIILRKLSEPLKDAGDRPAWVEAQDTTVLHESGAPMKVCLNRAYIQDASLMLGQPIVGAHGMYGRNEFTVKGDGRNLAASLEETLRRVLPEALFAAPKPAAPLAQGSQAANKRPQKDEPDPLEQSVQQELAGMGTARAGFEQARATTLLEIYTAAKRVIALQMEGAGDDELGEAQAELNRLYDRFRVRYGYINSKHNLNAFRKGNSLLQFLRALEEPAGRGGQYRKAPLFSTRTIRPLREKQSAETAQEALLLCLNERGGVDLDYAAEVCGKTAEQVRRELRGLVFRLPSGQWVTRDEYLSGNVRARLKEAEAAAQFDESFNENVEALRAAQPAPLGAGEITARLGAAWIPTEVIDDFARYLVPRYRGRVKYLQPTAQWVVDLPHPDVIATPEASQAWGTKRVHALDILDDALNLRRTVVYDQIDEKTRVVNQTETVAAQAKLQDMKERFQEWVWQDAARERELCRIYNEQFNTTRERAYDGSHLTLPGASNRIELRPHQKDAVWRVLQSKTTLVGHCVGAGKTLTAVAASHEMRRLNIARKSMIVVPKHVVPQWAQEAQRLYPGLRMLTTDAKDFTKHNRGETLSRIATCDWDLIIVPHPSFKLLPVSEETANKFINREIERLRDYISELTDEGSRENKRSIKQLEKTIKRFEAKLKSQNSEIRRDDAQTITFEELGVEALFVDECFTYKTLILTDRGMLQIGDIVENRLRVKVLACDTNTGKLEWKSVVRWLPKKLTGKLVKVTHERGSFVCTPNHKIWTEEEGYVRAGNLQPYHHMRVLPQTVHGAEIVEAPTLLQHEMLCTSSSRKTGNVAMPPLSETRATAAGSGSEKVLRQGVPLSRPQAENHQDLRVVQRGIHISFNRQIRRRKETILHKFVRFFMAHGTAREVGKVASGTKESLWKILDWKEAPRGFGANEAQQSDEQSGHQGKGESSQTRAHLSLAGRQRTADQASTTTCECTVSAHRVPDPDGTSKEAVPIAAQLLQGGHSEPGNQTGYRGGWADAQVEEVEIPRPAEGVRLTSARVVSVEVLESTGDGESGRSVGGNRTVYDLEVADHHNYFADGVLVSNCHIYKNLYFPTKMSRIAGLANSESQQAFDMFIKVQWLLGQQGRVVFLTGTPVSNTLCEVWIMMRYLQLDLLKELGMDHFDAWAQAFAETTTGVEMKPDGSGFRVHTRFNKFVNLPELSRLWRQCLDVRTPEQLNLPRPSVIGGSPVIVSVPASEELIEFVGELSHRSEKVRTRDVHPSVDNMLKITSEGRKAALDMRLVRPALDESPESKVEALVERVGRIYQRTNANRGAQLIFCDLATPKGRGGVTKAETALDEAA